MSDFNCPYCEKPIEVCHDDGEFYEQDRLHRMECPHCDKTLVFNTTISVDHEAFKADCLNGAAHQYKETQAWPRIARVLRCATCEDEKPLPEEVRAEYRKEFEADLNRNEAKT